MVSYVKSLRMRVMQFQARSAPVNPFMYRTTGHNKVQNWTCLSWTRLAVLTPIQNKTPTKLKEVKQNELCFGRTDTSVVCNCALTCLDMHMSTDLLRTLSASAWPEGCTLTPFYFSASRSELDRKGSSSAERWLADRAHKRAATAAAAAAALDCNVLQKHTNQTDL